MILLGGGAGVTKKITKDHKGEGGGHKEITEDHEGGGWSVKNSDGNVIQDMPKLTGYLLSDTGIG